MARAHSPDTPETQSPRWSPTRSAGPPGSPTRPSGAGDRRPAGQTGATNGWRSKSRPIHTVSNGPSASAACTVRAPRRLPVCSLNSTSRSGPLAATPRRPRPAARAAPTRSPVSASPARQPRSTPPHRPARRRGRTHSRLGARERLGIRRHRGDRERCTLQRRPQRAHFDDANVAEQRVGPPVIVPVTSMLHA